MTQEEFKQHLIIAAVQGLCSNPVQVQEAGVKAAINSVSATKIIAALAVSIANETIQMEN